MGLYPGGACPTSSTWRPAGTSWASSRPSSAPGGLLPPAGPAGFPLAVPIGPAVATLGAVVSRPRRARW
ncbi:hypothetical protein [Streptomyces sparsogenes]|uniref:hypothetical protein n=1 Tax=Streptomyces sparsogenes TaxID=67365 RepID=UPI0033C9C291